MIRLQISALLALLLTACGQQSAPEPEAAPEAGPNYVGVTIVATVPEGTGEVFIATNHNDWTPNGAPMTPNPSAEDERVAQILLEEGYALEYKFTLGTWEQEATNEDGFPYPNFQLTAMEGTLVTHEIAGFERPRAEILADPEGSGAIGTLIHWPDVASEFLEPTRTVSIWLPPAYDAPENADRRYPVIYMTDGQNLFDPRLSNYGVDWGVDEAMVRGMERGAFEPAIIVSHFSTVNRGQEYSPWHDAPLLARMVIEELKPRIDQEFRTLTGPENTFTMGSSMGGLHSMFLVLNYPEVFSACGCVSSHLPFSEAVVARYSGLETPEEPDEVPYFQRDIEQGRFTPPAGARMFFDWGTATLDAGYPEPHAYLRNHLLSLGLVEGEDVLFREYPGAPHNEEAWRERVEDQLVWLLAKDVPAE